MKLTPEQIEENLKCYRQAMIGDVDQLQYFATDTQEWVPKTSTPFYPDTAYRRKPQPKLVPYTAETWPLSARWVRWVKLRLSTTVFHAVECVSSNGVVIRGIQNSGMVMFEDLIANYELTRKFDENGQPIWEPCGRMVEP